MLSDLSTTSMTQVITFVVNAELTSPPMLNDFHTGNGIRNTILALNATSASVHQLSFSCTRKVTQSISSASNAAKNSATLLNYLSTSPMMPITTSAINATWTSPLT